MYKNRMLQLTRCIRPRMGAAGVMLALAIASMSPVLAEVKIVDPMMPPEMILTPEEVGRLQTLCNTSAVWPVLAPSPNGAFQFAYVASASFFGLGFVNLHTGQLTEIPMTTMLDYIFIGGGDWCGDNVFTQPAISAVDGRQVLVQIDAFTGMVIEATPLPLGVTDFLVQVSPRCNQILVTRQPMPEAGVAGRKMTPDRSPLQTIDPHPSFLPEREMPAIVKQIKKPSYRIAKTSIQLVVINLETGKEQVVTDINQDDIMFDLTWSPSEDSVTIILGDVPDNTRGGGIDVDSPSVQDALGKLHPRNNPFFMKNVLHLFNLSESGVTHKELRPNMKDGALFGSVKWFPDGRLMLVKMLNPSRPKGRTYPVYAMRNSAFYRIYHKTGWMLREIDSPKINSVDGLGLPISPYEMVFSVINGISSELYYHNFFIPWLYRVEAPVGTMAITGVIQASKEVVYTFNSYNQPSELFRQSVFGKDPLQVTSLNEDAKAANAVDIELLDFTLKNGAKRKGFVLHPAGQTNRRDGKIPLVVWQQGGPGGSMPVGWATFTEMPFNTLPNFGISLLVVPMPGRYGFGPAFYDALVDHANFGQIDIQEQIEIVDQLVASGYTDWSMVGITGCSYGGYFSSQSIGSTARYAAANPQCNLLNLEHEWELGYKSLVSYLMGKTPADAPEEYFRDSPIQFGNAVQTPTLLFQGKNDFLPYQFVHDFHDAIEAAGTEVDFYKFLYEGHGLGSPVSQLVASQAQIQWFRTYLGQ